MYMTRIGKAMMAKNGDMGKTMMSSITLDGEEKTELTQPELCKFLKSSLKMWISYRDVEFLFH